MPSEITMKMSPSSPSCQPGYHDQMNKRQNPMFLSLSTIDIAGLARAMSSASRSGIYVSVLQCNICSCHQCSSHICFLLTECQNNSFRSLISGAFTTTLSSVCQESIYCVKHQRSCCCYCLFDGSRHIVSSHSLNGLISIQILAG